AGHGTWTFTNAPVEADVAHPPGGYRAAWFPFDNTTHDGTAIGITEARGTAIDAPIDTSSLAHGKLARLPHSEGSYIRVSVSAIGAEHQSWGVPVDAYFRLVGGQWKLVGFERMKERS